MTVLTPEEIAYLVQAAGFARVVAMTAFSKPLIAELIVGDLVADSVHVPHIQARRPQRQPTTKYFRLR